MNKKAIIILGAIFILIVLTLGFLIYKRTTQTETPESEPTPLVVEPVPTEPVNVGQEGQAVRLTDEPVISPILKYRGDGISYFDRRGQIYQTDLQIDNGQVLLSNKNPLNIALKSNIARVLWPKNGDRYMAEFNSTGRTTWSVYEPIKGAYTDLPANVSALDWMPSGDRIALIWVDGSGKATLQLANPDATGYQNLAQMYQNDNVISVAPDGMNIIFFRKQTVDLTKNAINMVSIDGKTFNTVVKDGYNSGALWSPDSKKILFSKRDSSSPEATLWIVDVTNGQTTSLGVRGSVDKAVWTKDSLAVIAAVPKSGLSGAELTQDIFYHITLGTSEQRQIDPGIAVDGRDLFFSADESVLFFRNAQDNSLYFVPTI